MPIGRISDSNRKGGVLWLLENQIFARDGPFVELYLKSSLNKGLLAAQKRLQDFGAATMKFGAMMSGLGASILTPLVAATKHFITSGDELDKVSARTGVAVERLAELRYAAEQSGASLGDVENALRGMQRRGFDAARFDEIAAEIQAIEDPSKRAARAMEVFGRSGTMMLPMLGSLRELSEQARRFGLVPTAKSVKDAVLLGDTFDDVKSVILAAVYEIGSALTPILQPALEQIRGITITVGKWVRENGQLVRQIAMIGAGVLAAGAAITVVGATVFGIGTAFGLMAGAIGAVVTVAGALLTPIGLIALAVTAGVVAWARFTEAGRATVTNLQTWFGQLGATIKDTFGGISDALAGGDLVLAAEVARAGMMVVWQTLVQDVGALWSDAKFLFMATWQEASNSIAKSMVSAFYTIKGVWLEVVQGMKVIWNGLQQTVKEVWNKAVALGALAVIERQHAHGLLDDEQYRQMHNAIMGLTEKQLAEDEKIHNQRLLDITNEGAAKQKAIDEEAAGMQEALDSMHLDALENMHVEHDEEIKARRKALEDAKAALAALREKAGRVKEMGLLGTTMYEDPAEKLTGALGGGGSFGSFSAAGLIAGARGGGVKEVVAELKKNNTLANRILEATIKKKPVELLPVA